MELLLSDKRFRWISTMYFYAAANAENTINPFKNLVDFLEVKVGDLWWGTDKDTRNSSKSRFCSELLEMMHMHGFHMAEDELRKFFSDDSMSNEAMAQRLAGAVRSI
ncbi:MAG TPA: hypothetical protein VNB90_11200 [Cytophagaceae bacterium]|nr:hypothetical protein [Cytophagaceae bacterium]